MTSTPPPIESKIAADSFHYKAASYAVWILLAGVVVNVGLSSATQGPVAPGLKLIFSAIPALLIVSAFPAGIIALIGIPKYGTKKLLWKGLVGVVVPVLLIAMAVPAFLKVKQMSEERARQSQQNPK